MRTPLLIGTSSYTSFNHLLYSLVYPQEEELLRILLFAIQVLRQYLTVNLSTLGHSDISLLSDFLQLTSKVLNWDFQISRFSPVPLNIADVTTVILRPPRSYSATFLDPTFLNLLFTLLGKLSDREDLLHHVMQGLTQLASLSKPVLDCKEEQQTYLTNFVTGILSYISTRLGDTCTQLYINRELLEMDYYDAGFF